MGKLGICLLLTLLSSGGCVVAGGSGTSSTGAPCGQQSDSCTFDSDCCGGLVCVVNHCTVLWSAPNPTGGSSGGASTFAGATGGSSVGSTIGGFGSSSQGLSGSTGSVQVSGSQPSTTGGGFGGAGQLCLSPTALDFGSVQVASSSTLTVEVSNCGQLPLSFTALPIAGPDAVDFNYDPTGELETLAAGTTVDVTVSFSPQAMASYTAYLSYTVDGATGNLPLTGSGVDAQLVFSPSPIVFQDVAVGATAQQIVTATNVGNEALMIQDDVERSGSTAFAAADLPSLPLQLAPLQQVSFTVTYTPSGAAAGDQGAFSVGWTLTDSDVALRSVSDTLTGN